MRNMSCCYYITYDKHDIYYFIRMLSWKVFWQKRIVKGVIGIISIHIVTEDGLITADDRGAWGNMYKA